MFRGYDRESGYNWDCDANWNCEVSMDFLELVEARGSVRSYDPRPVEPEKLARVLEAVRLAPSGSNRQPWRFVVVQEAETRERLVAACANQSFIAGAPVVVAGVGLMPDRVMRCGVPGDPVDLAIALTHLSLAAASEGLGTCWIGAFDQDAVRDVLGIPKDVRVIELMTLGYPDAAARVRSKTRKSLDEIICYERWK
jgi:nitroreductase